MAKKQRLEEVQGLKDRTNAEIVELEQKIERINADIQQAKASIPEVQNVEERYHIVPEEGRRKEEILALVAKERGCLAKGGEADTARAAGLLLDDFRSGRLGQITLEFPEPEKEVQHGE